MRLKPPVTPEAALEWLKSQVAESWQVEITPEVEKGLRVTAEAMAVISALDIPEDAEPLLL